MCVAISLLPRLEPVILFIVERERGGVGWGGGRQYKEKGGKKFTIQTKTPQKQQKTRRGTQVNEIP